MASYKPEQTKAGDLLEKLAAQETFSPAMTGIAVVGSPVSYHAGFASSEIESDGGTAISIPGWLSEFTSLVGVGGDTTTYSHIFTVPTSAATTDDTGSLVATTSMVTTPMTSSGIETTTAISSSLPTILVTTGANPSTSVSATTSATSPTTSLTTSSTSTSNGGLKPGAIAGILVGVFLVVAPLLVLGVTMLVCRKRKRTSEDEFARTAVWVTNTGHGGGFLSEANNSMRDHVMRGGQSSGSFETVPSGTTTLSQLGEPGPSIKGDVSFSTTNMNRSTETSSTRSSSLPRAPRVTRIGVASTNYSVPSLQSASSGREEDGVVLRTLDRAGRAVETSSDEQSCDEQSPRQASGVKKGKARERPTAANANQGRGIPRTVSGALPEIRRAAERAQLRRYGTEGASSLREEKHKWARQIIAEAEEEEAAEEKRTAKESSGSSSRD